MAETKETTAVTETEGTVLKLSKPVEINGEMMTEIPYDLDSLTGKDIQHAVKELSKRNIQILVSELDQNYHAMLFAISAGLSFEDVSLLGMKDYNKMTSIVRDFFLQE